LLIAKVNVIAFITSEDARVQEEYSLQYAGMRFSKHPRFLHRARTWNNRQLLQNFECRI